MPMPSPQNWPFEVCDTTGMCDNMGNWAYTEKEVAFKSTTELIRKLIAIVGLGGNYLLNQAPMASGEVQPEEARRLKEMGAWLKKHGQSIYGTRPVAMIPPAWGYAVSKGPHVYLHVLRWPGNRVKLEGLKANVQSASLLGGQTLNFVSKQEGVIVDLPESARDSIDTIVVLKVDEPLYY